MAGLPKLSYAHLPTYEPVGEPVGKPESKERARSLKTKLSQSSQDLSSQEERKSAPGQEMQQKIVQALFPTGTRGTQEDRAGQLPAHTFFNLPDARSAQPPFAVGMGERESVTNHITLTGPCTLSTQQSQTELLHNNMDLLHRPNPMGRAGVVNRGQF